MELSLAPWTQGTRGSVFGAEEVSSKSPELASLERFLEPRRKGFLGALRPGDRRRLACGMGWLTVLQCRYGVGTYIAIGVVSLDLAGQRSDDRAHKPSLQLLLTFSRFSLLFRPSKNTGSCIQSSLSACSLSGRHPHSLPANMADSSSTQVVNKNLASQNVFPLPSPFYPTYTIPLSRAVSRERWDKNDSRVYVKLIRIFLSSWSCAVQCSTIQCRTNKTNARKENQNLLYLCIYLSATYK